MHHPLYILSLLHPLLSAAARANESVIRNGKSTVNDEKTAASVASAGTTTEVLAKDKDKPSGGSALCNGSNFQLSRDGSYVCKVCGHRPDQQTLGMKPTPLGLTTSVPPLAWDPAKLPPKHFFRMCLQLYI
ncbi:hypothetical protein PCASD_08298 [Puccinia coronata f. sp. avenae]|uniref:GATA-type domain-containing protein n=1 Tax=Puccinia coronata f. sp. avenae TaxID=200324 RepID=A0A2N5V105_9BASI|nr:hypothetical protein PCASD_08298 [Puccinia coronata f. sp. avenae]